MKKNLFPFLIALLFSGCNDQNNSDPAPLFFTRSYVVSYYEIEGISLVEAEKELAEVLYSGRPTIKVYTQRGESVGSFDSVGAEKEVYDALCEKHGDMSYNTERMDFYGGVPVKFPSFSAVDYVSVDMVSSADYDVEHPAGELLNDLITVYYRSPKNFIDNGYESKYLWEGATVSGTDAYGNPTEWVVGWEKNLAEFSADDMVLLGNGDGELLTLAFDRLPTMAKTHTITVTMTAEDGRIFSGSIGMNFE